MKIIFKIAKTELRNLFYSPVAWFLTIAFLIQCAIFYTYGLYPIAKWQEIALKNNPKFKDFGFSLTKAIYLDPNGIFATILQNLYLFIPLLTMGLISREINNGTIKLLYSSPVKISKIVFGKYLAIMMYNLLLVLVVWIFMMTGVFTIRSIDYGIILSATLGFYLLLCAYTAIGLFMSSLTTYQIVSAIGSFIAVFVLSRIGGLWQKYDFVRDLTYFLSISGRTNKMLNGLITTKDVFYFIIVVYIFVGLTLIKLQGGRESKPWYIKAGRYMAIIISALLVGYVSSRPSLTGYWDTTAQNVNTLHPNLQKLVRELGDEPLEITMYTNLLGTGLQQGLPENRNNYLAGLWEPYVRFKPDIKFKYVYYYDQKKGDSTYYRQFPGKNLQQIAKQMAEGYDTRFSMYQSPQELHKTIDLEPENYRLVMQVKYKGRSEFLRTFNDAYFWPQDQQIAAVLKRLLKADRPKVAFVSGNLERNIYKAGEREYRLHAIDKEYRYSLLNMGFDADTISLDTQKIPANITTLVLADPKTELSAATSDKLRTYIKDGGNMFVLGEPGKQQMLNPLLRSLGVQLVNGTLVEVTKDEMPQMVHPYLTPAGADLSDEPTLRGLRESLKEKDNEDSIKMLMPGVAALSYVSDSGFAIAPLLMTIPNHDWNKAGALVTDSVPPLFTPSEGDTRQSSFPVGIALTRKVNGKEQRIVICGDADFMSNIRGGGDFIARAVYSWLNYNKFPIYTPQDMPKDGLLKISPAGANFLKVLYIWILPALILILGTVLLIRRKRK